MADLKTKPNARSVAQFVNGVADAETREDCLRLLALMKQVTKTEPRMWGTSIVGFGSYRYRYESGREGEWFLTGFSPRKQSLTVYLMAGLDRYAELLASLGKHSRGKSCLYVKRLDDVKLPVLKKLIHQSVKDVAKANT